MYSETEWWIDSDSWPGPVAQPALTVEELLDSYIRAFSGAFGGLAKALQIVGTRASTAELEAIKAAFDVTNKIEKKETGRGRVRNHGPRPAATFDRRGNRRY